MAKTAERDQRARRSAPKGTMPRATPECSPRPFASLIQDEFEAAVEVQCRQGYPMSPSCLAYQRYTRRVTISPGLGGRTRDSMQFRPTKIRRPLMSKNIPRSLT
jgi:hypothetical protein